MARDDNRQKAGMARYDLVMDMCGNLLLTGMGAGRKPTRSLLDPIG